MASLDLESAPSTPPYRVVSFVVFGDKPVYTRGAVENAKLIPLVYPGWTGRFYAGDDVPPTILEDLAAAGSEIVPFDRLRWPGRSAQLLRFRPAGEVGVDAVIVRDTDSRVNPREAAAVAAWLSSGKRFHFMHEAMHDARYGAVMGGMWGCCVAGAGSDDGAPVPGLAEAVAAFERRFECSEARGASWEASGAELRAGDEPRNGNDSGTPGAAPSSGAASSIGGAAYGDDMAFLDRAVVPLVTEGNALHHVDGDFGRALGALPAGLLRLPFPASSFRGFVGAPVTCRCAHAAFASAGCGHCSREIPGALASRLGIAPGALAALGGFLG